MLDIAEAESLGPALAFACRTHPPAWIPPPVRQRWERALVEATARHLMLSGELGRLLKSFQREQVPVIPLKGASLAENFYAHPALRLYSDLDLLIRREHLERIDDLLQRFGYHRLADDHSFRFDVAYDRATLYAAASGVHVDLHWSLLSEPRYSWDEGAAASLWDRAVRLRVAGEDALGLCPEDLLLYLTMHLAVHHSLTGLLWLYDVFLVLERSASTLDWEAVTTRASRWRVRTAAYFALREVQRLFGARVPTALMDELEPRGPRAAAMAWLLRHRAPSQRRAAEHVIGLLLVDRGRDLVGTLWRVLFPPSDWLRARYEGAGTSRLARYVAHCRRLGHVAHQAAAALYPPRR